MVLIEKEHQSHNKYMLDDLLSKFLALLLKKLKKNLASQWW